MRIISGEFKGRELKGPSSRLTRPLSDKVRGALFNILGDVADWSVLDVYAGTGAVAFEALSRGAKFAEAIESNKSAAKVIQANAKTLNAADRLNLVVSEVEKWLDWPMNKPAERYDLIFADPPYTQLNQLVLIRLSNYLKTEGILAVSHSSKQESPVLEGLELIQTKTYGDSALSFYRLQ